MKYTDVLCGTLAQDMDDDLNALLCTLHSHFIPVFFPAFPPSYGALPIRFIPAQSAFADQQLCHSASLVMSLCVTGYSFACVALGEYTAPQPRAACQQLQEWGIVPILGDEHHPCDGEVQSTQPLHLVTSQDQAED